MNIDQLLTIYSTMNIPQLLKSYSTEFKNTNLSYYLNLMVTKNPSAYAPYHNNYHELGLLKVCMFYLNAFGDEVSEDEQKALFYACCFHDWNHSMGECTDDVNIERAIEGVEEHLLEEDRYLLPMIKSYIKATEYNKGYVIPKEDLTLCQKIIRDCDLTWVLNIDLLDKYIFPLMREMKFTDTVEFLKLSIIWWNEVKFNTSDDNERCKDFNITVQTMMVTELTDLLKIFNK